MAVKAPVVSTLNPHAPLFIPAAYIDTEDFSPEWWCLVENCPAFRDYWLRERYQMEEEMGADDLEVLEAAAAEMELMEEEEEGMELVDEDVALYNSDNKEPDHSLVKDFGNLDLNSVKEDTSPSPQEMPS